MTIEHCSNPDLEIDGDIWETSESVPDEWRSRDGIPGRFEIAEDGLSGTFIGPDGASMPYTLVTGFRKLICNL